MPAEPAAAPDLALPSRAPGAAVSPELLAAYAKAAAPNSLRAFRSDVLAFDVWCRGRGQGPVFRRVIVRRYVAKQARPRTNPASLAWNARWDAKRFAAKAAVQALVETDVGERALHPGSVTPILRSLLRRAYAAGTFPVFDAATFANKLSLVSAHSTRVGVNQD